MRLLFISVSGLFNCFDSILRQLNYDLVGKVVSTPEDFKSIDKYIKSFCIFVPEIYDKVLVKLGHGQDYSTLAVKEIIDLR